MNLERYSSLIERLLSPAKGDKCIYHSVKTLQPKWSKTDNWTKVAKSFSDSQKPTVRELTDLFSVQGTTYITICRDGIEISLQLRKSSIPFVQDTLQCVVEFDEFHYPIFNGELCTRAVGLFEFLEKTCSGRCQGEECCMTGQKENKKWYASIFSA